MSRKNIPVKVAIVEDDHRLRMNLKEMLGEDPECVCVGDYASAEEAIRELPKRRPDVVTVDVNLTGATGIECVRALSPILPDTEFLMLTIHKDLSSIISALAAGADGYLTKPVRCAQFLAAIRDVVAGGAPMTGLVARQLIGTFQALPTPSEELTERETRVLELLSQGLLYKQVAADMNISMNTVYEFIRRIYGKLHVHSRKEATAAFLKSQGQSSKMNREG